MPYNHNTFPKWVNISYRIIGAEGVKVFTAAFFNGVAVEPAAEIGTIEPTLVVNHAGLAVMALRAETEGKLRGERSAHVGNVAVWIVGVLRGDVPCLGDVSDDVSVVVVAWDVEHAINRRHKPPLSRYFVEKRWRK